ncbi:MAG: amidohydrolase family protein [Prolixibacteraceae bacterium]|jgi:cytosine/adenosine deaminase-related metal-dependent hydrolase|nr:amidohydrolase family protein [Prolixibacteraceae bacterium]
MRKISAHLILDGLGHCYTKGIVTLDWDGTILNIEDTGGALRESAEVEFFSGMLVPGFINAHCHLELSHMHNTFPESAGFVPFLKKVVETRASEPEYISEAAEKADILMYKNGIVAVGDIANGTTAFEAKKNSSIYYFTFLETLGFNPGRSEKAFHWADNCIKLAESMGLKGSIVPHAPYSVSNQLFEAVAIEATRSGLPISIHSQESLAEDDLYRTGSGEMVDHLRDNLGIETSHFTPTGESALRSTLKLLPVENHLLLVHNLFTTQSDLDYISTVRKLSNTWFVLCPGSNLYIQNRLPNIDLFRRNELQICLGTDSLASNHQLSILEEMKIIQQASPSIPLDELLGWATIHGANALGISDWAGSIEIGKRPGINLLTNVDFSERKLFPGTRLKKIC